MRCAKGMLAVLGLACGAPVAAQEAGDTVTAMQVEDGADRASAYLPAIAEPGAGPVAPIADIGPAGGGDDGDVPQIAPELRADEDAPDARIDPARLDAGRARLRAQMTTFCMAMEQGCEMVTAPARPVRGSAEAQGEGPSEGSSEPGEISRSDPATDLRADPLRSRAYTSGMDAVIDAIRHYPEILRCETDLSGEETCRWE